MFPTALVSREARGSADFPETVVVMESAEDGGFGDPGVVGQAVTVLGKRDRQIPERLGNPWAEGHVGTFAVVCRGAMGLVVAVGGAGEGFCGGRRAAGTRRDDVEADEGQTMTAKPTPWRLSKKSYAALSTRIGSLRSSWR